MNFRVHGAVGLSAKLVLSGSKVGGKSAVRDELIAQQTAWIKWLEQTTGKSLAAIAREAGISQNLLTRRIAEGGLLSTAIKGLLTKSTGLPGPDTFLDAPAASLSEEAAAYRASADDLITKALVETALEGRPNASPWRLQVSSLREGGYLPGDILIVDSSATPSPGEIVCVQHYDMRGGAETIFRVYQFPYVVGLDEATRKPLMVDNARVVVVGPVTEMIRPRRQPAR
jgi:hypothetical protein